MSNISRVFLEPSAVVCVESVIQGDVRIGHRTIVHPHAQILATNGPIIIGNENIFEEYSVLENRSPFPLIVGNQNFFEVKSVVRARKIGHNNLFNVKCTVGEMVTVGNYTTFGVNVLTNPASPIKPADLSVFFGNDPTQHRISATKPDAQEITGQIDNLAQVLPRYHHIKKTSRQF